MVIERFNYDLLDVRAVQAADPLAADAACRALPRWNERGDVRTLCEALRALLPLPRQIAWWPPGICLAAMRDMGVFLGSIKRHGVEPLVAVPEAEAVLLGLAARTDMVPRDTVHHYVAWNPTGERARTYTSDPMERSLMHSVRLSLPALGSVVEFCRRAVACELDDPAFVTSVTQIADRIKMLEGAITVVLERVSPVFFAQTMRPYFEDIQVGGRRYLGPAAAHVPLSLIDLALSSSDGMEEGGAYARFWRESAEFALPAWRDLYETWCRAPSLVTRLGARLEAGETPALRRAAEALSRALQTLIVFRGRHLRIARQAYAEDVRRYELGSGGGTIPLLASVLLLTRQNAGLVRNVLDARCAASPTTTEQAKEQESPC